MAETESEGAALSEGMTPSLEELMAIVVLSETPNMTKEQFDKVSAELGLDDLLPEGCHVHIAGVGPDGSTWRDISVWESAAQAKHFTRGWFDDFLTGRARSYGEIAKKEGVTKRYVGHVIPLAFIAPEIVAAILAGDHPIELTAEALTKRIDLPLAWSEQRARLGYH